MTASKIAKMVGLKDATTLYENTELTRPTVYAWAKSRPKALKLLAIGCLVTESMGDDLGQLNEFLSFYNKIKK